MPKQPKSDAPAPMPKQPTMASCLQCGENFIQYRKAQKFCNLAHKNAFNYRARGSADTGGGREKMEEVQRLARLVRADMGSITKITMLLDLIEE